MKSIAECTCNFAIDYLKRQMKENSEKNMFFPPLSLATALISIVLGSYGTTASQIKELLGSPCYESGGPYSHWKQIMSAITQHFESYRMKLVQRLYLSDRFEVLQSYKCCIKEMSNSELESVDFMNSTEKVREKINLGVEKGTNDLIKDLLPANSILPSSLLVSASAFYMRGRWKSPFNPSKTYTAPFWTSKDRSINVQMMTQLGNFNIATITYPPMKVLELPHENGEICSYIFLPEGLLTIDEIVKKFSYANFLQWISSENMKSMTANISVPKLNLRDNCSMKPYLMEMGVTDMFLLDKANLSGISEREGLFVTDIRSAVYFDMDEEGTVVIGGSRTEVVDDRSHFEVKCNKPFLMFVTHKPTSFILFLGMVFNPQ